jgi:hypothetical protein
VIADREAAASSFPRCEPGLSGGVHKKPDLGNPGIGAQLASFNFTNNLI